MLACSQTKLQNYSTERTLHNIHRKRTIKTDVIHNDVFVQKTNRLSQYNSGKQHFAQLKTVVTLRLYW